MRRKPGITTVLSLCLGMFFNVTTAAAQTQPTAHPAPAYVFLMITSSMPVAGAGLHLAISAAKTGRDVHIMLLADGLNLGLPETEGVVFAPYRATGADMLAMAMAEGAQVYVCQICLRNRGIPIEFMAEGIASINAIRLLEITDAADVVMTFGADGVGPMQMSGGTVSAPSTMPLQTAPGDDACDPASDPDECM